MKKHSTRFFASLASILFLGTTIASAEQIPGAGQAGGLSPEAAMRAAVAVPADGLKVFYDKYGRYRVAVGAKGSNNASHYIRISKPRGAVVERAFLMAANFNFSSFVPINDGDITLDGKTVVWTAAVNNAGPGILFTSVKSDVTRLVKRKIDRARPGTVKFKIKELVNNTSIDGEVLVVVFKKKTYRKRNIVLLFGGQRPTGDSYEVTLGSPIDKTKPGARARMGVGISYSFQSASATNQYSVIDVNSRRLTTSAGGQDDGAPFNGGLITVGGRGDSPNNPPNPFAIPSGPRTDDESYNLLPFIKKTDKKISIRTSNTTSVDDNMFFAWFDLSSKADVNKDTDGDGLLDSWERFGYDHDGDGKIDVNLPALGANYRKKDIFVAYAWMVAGSGETSSHEPSAAVLNAVRDSFAAAPVSNPNGTTGIKLHFINKGSVAHDQNLSPVWDEFDALMNPKVSVAERQVMHRMLNGHMYNGGTSSGLSRGIPASDFIETLGGWSSNPGTFKQRAGTIMHELGHNLGLRHGGPDHENYKPNHLSVMSYFNQVVWLMKNGADLLDYERFDLNALNEASVSEPAGLNRVGGDGPIANYGVRYFAGGVQRSKGTGASSNVDWNFNGSVAGNVAVDLNDSGGNSVLNANYPEWANIEFKGGDIGLGLASGKANEIRSAKDLEELTEEEYLRMKSKIHIDE